MVKSDFALDVATKLEPEVPLEIIDLDNVSRRVADIYQPLIIL